MLLVRCSSFYFVCMALVVVDLVLAKCIVGNMGKFILVLAKCVVDLVLCVLFFIYASLTNPVSNAFT